MPIGLTWANSLALLVPVPLVAALEPLRLLLSLLAIVLANQTNQHTSARYNGYKILSDRRYLRLDIREMKRPVRLAGRHSNASSTIASIQSDLIAGNFLVYLSARLRVGANTSSIVSCFVFTRCSRRRRRRSACGMCLAERGAARSLR